MYCEHRSSDFATILAAILLLSFMSELFQNLLGANRKCADEMQAQTIELPQDMDQLQFLCLQLREELIETRAAKEHMVEYVAVFLPFNLFWPKLFRSRKMFIFLYFLAFALFSRGYSK